jgi:hypothetical protein
LGVMGAWSDGGGCLAGRRWRSFDFRHSERLAAKGRVAPSQGDEAYQGGDRHGGENRPPACAPGESGPRRRRAVPEPKRLVQFVQQCPSSTPLKPRRIGLVENYTLSP